MGDHLVGMYVCSIILGQPRGTRPGVRVQVGPWTPGGLPLSFPNDKPTTLSGLRKLVQAIDACYWERKAEIARETPAANSSGNKSDKNNNNKSSSDKGKGSSQSKQKNNNNSSSSSNQNKGHSSEPKKMLTPDYASKLGKDGKLTPQERQRRIDKNLCLCCGASGHRASDCPKCQAAAKARTSKTTPTTQESTSTPKHCCSEAKKD